MNRFFPLREVDCRLDAFASPIDLYRRWLFNFVLLDSRCSSFIDAKSQQKAANNARLFLKVRIHEANRSQQVRNICRDLFDVNFDSLGKVIQS